MANWKNLITSPPNVYGYFLFKVESKTEFIVKGNPKIEYVLGCLKPVDKGNPTKILYKREPTFIMDKEAEYLIHTIDTEKYNYKFVDVNEIL